MLIDKYLDKYQFSEYHEIDIAREAGNIYPVIKKINFKKSKVLNLLFSVRGLPEKMQDINGFIESGFILLEERANEEIVMGFLFGVTVREIKVVTPEAFREFKDTNYIKGVWNFRLRAENNRTILSTETRIFCPSKTSKLFFSVYWFFISYFSGLTRMIILRLIKQEAELLQNNG
ncbi:MAG: hypothetical protein A2X59_07925 [Nitrospirae bacterium GWC2_42_7]|nr:MAG: hypothetical protein A2X59_07925 [Nitrospirae bacterium GWC2_42_7]